MQNQSLRFYFAIIAIIVIIFASLVAMHIYSVQVFRKSQSKDLADTIRSDLVMGDRANALRILAARIGPDKNFVSIILHEIDENESSLVADRYGDRFIEQGVENYLFYGQVEIPIFFDKDMQHKYGHLSFYFDRFVNFSFAFIIWAVLSVVVIVFASRQRFIFRLDMEKKIIARKNEMIAQMTQMISHDLRAPLSSFERLLHLPFETQIASFRESLNESWHRLNAMIESIRYIDSETLVLKKEASLSFSTGSQGLTAKAEARNLTIDFPVDFRQAVNLDLPKFERAWINLVSNAIDFAKSEVVIHIETIDDELILRVIDDGPGVPGDFLPKLFQRGATYGKEDGTGLGLAYVRQIMRGHGGDVTYRRENGLTVLECRVPNAVEPEEQQAMENVASLELRLLQKSVRTVAICLEPENLSTSICKALASHKSEDFQFSEERNGAQIVVSNIDAIMFEVMDLDGQEFIHISRQWNDESMILDLLVRRFTLS